MLSLTKQNVEVPMQTEKEKMLSGQLYNPSDKELQNDRIQAKNLCQKYNNIPYDNFKERQNIIKNILNSTGKNITIEPSFYCDYGYNIDIGENFYSNHNLVILDCAKVTIGDNVAIGPNCNIYCALHPLNSEERITWKESAKPVNIGHNVWLGGNVTILPNVTIGNNSVIGAGSVVTKNIPDNTLAVGNPCKVIRKLS